MNELNYSLLYFIVGFALTLINSYLDPYEVKRDEAFLFLIATVILTSLWPLTGVYYLAFYVNKKGLARKRKAGL
jgi:hypothetical protein